jgi:1-deoxyxylulose-5-phosphate synthase
VEQRALGGSGIEVSRIILGCGNFGGIGSAPELFGRGESHDEAFAIMDAAWEKGITTFDTADAYGGGRSETMIGEWLREQAADVRDRLVLSTKTFNPMEAGADRGLSARRITRQLESSLARLGVERVHLYLTHEWDDQTPIEETLRALDEHVRDGKIGGIGASNVTGEQLAEAVELSELEGLARYEWVQNEYSLLRRDAEEDVLPVCREHGLSFTPFSPLAGGWLTGKYRNDEPPPEGSRMELRPGPYEELRTERVWRGLDALREEAERRGTSMATLAIAWVLAQPAVTAVVVGPRSPAQLEPACEALELDLSDADRERLAGLFA